ncbi:hypothetical protein Esti_000340 [Eimeria stiedai]
MMKRRPSYSGESPQQSSSFCEAHCVNKTQQPWGAGLSRERDLFSVANTAVSDENPTQHSLCSRGLSTGPFPWTPLWKGRNGFPPERIAVPHAVEKAISSGLGLPALQVGAQLLTTIRANLVTVVTGSTGCGKTTIVPLLLLLQHTNARLLIALPRRIAVQMAAERLRQLLGEELLGQAVGYHLGHEDACRSADTRLLFVTAGMLRKYITGALRKLHVLGQTDVGCSSSNMSVGSLPQDRLRSIFPYDFVLVDEVHERTVDCDMALLLLKCLAVKLTTAAAREVQLPLFRIVVMSATISASDFATFLSGESLNIFEAEHAAWTDQTRLLRLRGNLENSQQLSADISHVTLTCSQTVSEAELQRSALRKRNSLLSWAKNLSVLLNELTRLWKSRRSRDLLRVLREQESSLASGGRSGERQWVRISDSASVRGNCVEVARQTNFPVEELFWEDLRGLAAAPFACPASQLLDVASPALLRFMGIDPADGEPFALQTSHGVRNHFQAILPVRQTAWFLREKRAARIGLTKDCRIPTQAHTFWTLLN